MWTHGTATRRTASSALKASCLFRSRSGTSPSLATWPHLSFAYSRSTRSMRSEGRKCGRAASVNAAHACVSYLCMSFCAALSTCVTQPKAACLHSAVPNCCLQHAKSFLSHAGLISDHDCICNVHPQQPTVATCKVHGCPKVPSKQSVFHFANTNLLLFLTFP